MNDIKESGKLEEKVSQDVYGTLQIEDSEQRDYARKVWYETKGKELGVDPENYGSAFDLDMKDTDLGAYLLEHKDLVYKLKIVPHQEKLGNAEFVKKVVNDLNNSLDSARKKYFGHIASVDPGIFKAGRNTQ